MKKILQSQKERIRKKPSIISASSEGDEEETVRLSCHSKNNRFQRKSQTCLLNKETTSKKNLDITECI